MSTPNYDSRYTTKGIPAYAGTRTKPYEPLPAFYNGIGKLVTFRGKLGLAGSGTGLCRIGIVGDSTVIGYGIEPKYSWPNILQQSVLPSLGFPSAGEAAFVQIPGTVTDSRFTYVGSGTNVGADGLLRVLTGAGSVQFTSTLTGTIAEFQFLAQTGTVTLAVDGAAPGTVTIVNGGTGVSYNAGTLTFASDTFKHVLIQVTGLSAASHALTATWASGTINVERFAVHNATGVMVDNVGVSGSRAVDWTGAPTYRDTYYTQGAGGQADLYDLLITSLGINDADGASGTYGPTTLPAYRTALTTVATGNGQGGLGQPTTADKLIVAQWYNSANGTASSWEPYVSAQYDVADSIDVPLIDLSARYTSTPPSMLFSDGTHPTRAGAYRIATDIGHLIAA